MIERLRTGRAALRAWGSGQARRVSYVLMLLALYAGYVLTDMLSGVAFLLRTDRRTGDVLLLPYYPEGNPGFRLRFEVLFPLLERDGVRYHVGSIGVMNPADYGDESRPYWSEYREYVRIYYRRLRQVLSARHYRAVYVQRALFPFYPDQRVARLSRLLRRVNDNVTVDFYDADYVANAEIVDSTIDYADKLTVVNTHLRERFSQRHPNVFELPLAIDAERYLVKRDYALHTPITLFWWGSRAVAEPFTDILPALHAVAERHPIRLVIVCRELLTLDGIEVVRHFWDPRTAFAHLQAADIALFPARDSEINRGGMAMKVLEYLAAAVPVVASPYALSPHVRSEHEMLIAKDAAEWRTALSRLIGDEDLRRRLGENGRAVVQRYHSPELSYRALRSIIFRPTDRTTVRPGGDRAPMVQ